MVLDTLKNLRRSRPSHPIKNSLIGINLSVFYKHSFCKQWFSTLILFTFKSCYTIMVLPSACLNIEWKQMPSYQQDLFIQGVQCVLYMVCYIYCTRRVVCFVQGVQCVLYKVCSVYCTKCSVSTLNF